MREFSLAESEREKTYNETKALLEEKISDIDTQLSSIGILHKDYYDFADQLAHLLKTGRADTLKEALNLVVAEKQREAAEAELIEQEMQSRREMEYLAEQQEAEMRTIAEEQADEARRHNQAMEAVAAQMLKEQRNAALRAQQQASIEKSKRHRAYLAARNEYNHAAMQYEGYSKQGLTQDALRWKRHMDEAYAEMLRNS